MKKLLIILLILSMTLIIINPISANDVSFANNAKAAYVIEYNSGKKVFAKNENEKLYPASMTKMMGLILIFQSLNNKSIQWDEIVTTSIYAASMGGSQIYLEENEQMCVEDLIKSICIASANDAMVAMAEKVSGSEENFVNEMNELAVSLKLENTHFENSTGLHHENHYSCAKDMAKIAQKLLEVGGKELLEITSTYEDYIREDKENKFWLVNTNKLIRQYEGVDGLKTGYTSQALSCICTTAIKNNIRFIVVVMGEPNSKVRNQEVIELLDYSYSLFEKKQLYKKGDIITTYTLEKSKEKNIQLICEDDVDVIYNKGEKIEITSQEIEWLNKSLPYKEKERVAKLKLELSNGEIHTSYLVTDKTFYKKTYFDIFWDTFKSFF